MCNVLHGRDWLTGRDRVYSGRGMGNVLRIRALVLVVIVSGGDSVVYGLRDSVILYWHCNEVSSQGVGGICVYYRDIRCCIVARPVPNMTVTVMGGDSVGGLIIAGVMRNSMLGHMGYL